MTYNNYYYLLIIINEYKYTKHIKKIKTVKN